MTRDEFGRCRGCLYSAGHALDCPLQPQPDPEPPGRVRECGYWHPDTAVEHNRPNCWLRPPNPTEPYADVPADVCDWLDETYTPEGVGIWLNAWSKADEVKRAHMVEVARIPSGGT